MEERDAIAAAARLALLGTSAELAVPFEELKPEIRERWRMVVEVAQGPVKMAERDALRAELEAVKAGRVKVKLPDVEDVNGHLIKNNFSTTNYICMGEALRFAAANAVIEMTAAGIV